MKFFIKNPIFAHWNKLDKKKYSLELQAKVTQ